MKVTLGLLAGIALSIGTAAALDRSLSWMITPPTTKEIAAAVIELDETQKRMDRTMGQLESRLITLDMRLHTLETAKRR